MRSVGSHSTSGREKEGIKERMGWELRSIRSRSMRSQTLSRRSSEDSVTSGHFKCGQYPPNEVGRFAQGRKVGRKGRKKGFACDHHLQFSP